MLIEEAFFSLPEILHGSGYQTQSYESGIVSALTLSLLQVLNGRNAPRVRSHLNIHKDRDLSQSSEAAMATPAA
jgi:hypothetical protein